VDQDKTTSQTVPSESPTSKRKILITGDRDWTDYGFIFQVLSDYTLGWNPSDITVIHGAARGADTCAAVAAIRLHFKINSYPANWNTYGRAAGPIRNRQMLDEEPHFVLAFHDNIKASKGTADMIRAARKKCIRVILHSHEVPCGIDCK
jgi:YspA, cpYpsA-related SLOG family